MSPTAWNVVVLLALIAFAMATPGTPMELLSLGVALGLAGRGVVDGEI